MKMDRGMYQQKMQTFEDLLQALYIAKVNLHVARQQRSKATDCVIVAAHRNHCQSTAMEATAARDDDRLNREMDFGQRPPSSFGRNAHKYTQTEGQSSIPDWPSEEERFHIR